MQQVTKLSATEDDAPAAVKKGMIKTKAELAFESMQQKRVRWKFLFYLLHVDVCFLRSSLYHLLPRNPLMPV